MREVEHHSVNTGKQDLYQLLPKVPSTIHCAFAGEAFVPKRVPSAPCYFMKEKLDCA